MRPLVLKYPGECRKCGAALAAGETAIYEKRVGIFCRPCAPTDPEEIRNYRQEAADRRADKYEEWAAKRRERAAGLHKQNDPYRGDIAFNTQPGHIPERARAIRRTEKAWEHSETAARFEAKAENLRHVRVAGDAERRHQARRDVNDTAIAKGSKIVDAVFGTGTVLGIFKKSYRIKWNRSGSVFARDKMFVRAVKRDPNPETELRDIWDRQGVPEERQQEILADITAKAQPGAKVGPFTVPD